MVSAAIIVQVDKFFKIYMSLCFRNKSIYVLLSMLIFWLILLQLTAPLTRVTYLQMSLSCWYGWFLLKFTSWALLSVDQCFLHCDYNGSYITFCKNLHVCDVYNHNYMPLQTQLKVQFAAWKAPRSIWHNQTWNKHMCIYQCHVCWSMCMCTYFILYNQNIYLLVCHGYVMCVDQL